MNDKLQPFLVIIATVGMIIFNYFAATGTLGGVMTNVPSDKHPTFLTPANYAFAIWSLIYLGCFAFSIYQAFAANREKFRPIRRIYIVSCVANCAWLYFWSQELLTVCLGVILILLGTLAFINTKLQKTETFGEFWLAKFPFGIYFGWVTAATILNATIALDDLGVKVSNQTAMWLGAILVFIAAVLGVTIRIKLTNYFYPLAIAWALTAIAVKQSGKTIIVATCAVAVITCLIAALSFVMNMPSSETRK